MRNSYTHQTGTNSRSKYWVFVFFLILGLSLFQPQRVFAQDTDGDGIADATDVDDDNDGILDTDECADYGKVIYGDWTGWASGSTTGTVTYPLGGVVTVNVAKTYTLNGSAISYSEVNGYPKVLAADAVTGAWAGTNFQNAYPAGYVSGANTLAMWVNGSRVTGTIIQESEFDFTTTAQGGTDQYTFIGFGSEYTDNPPRDTDILVYAYKADGTLETDYTGWTVVVSDVATTDPDGGKYYTPIESVDNTTSAGVKIDPATASNYTGDEDAVFVQVHPSGSQVYSKIIVQRKLVINNDWDWEYWAFALGYYNANGQTCDTDNDGIPNALDTDSDNDGCPDAIEGSASFNNADIDANGMLTGGVDANGVPTVANSGQGIGTSEDAATQDANCQAATITANDDDFSSTPIDAATGGTTPTVFTNDDANGTTPATDALIDDGISITNDGGLTGVSINTDGTINVPAGSTPGTYTVTYQICLEADNTVCDTANATIQVNASSSSTDTDGDGIADDVDLDDDNDGILDCVENGISNDIGDIFDINGDAQRLNAHQIRLTPAATYKSGSAFSYGKISFDKSFSFEIEVYLGNRDGNGADGLAIVFHNDPAGTGAVGATGSGLGARGIQNGIVLEFDTFNNGSGVYDITQDHGCIWDSDDQSATPLSPAVNLGNIEDGNWHTVHITWDAGIQKLSYTLDGTLAGEYTGDLINNYFGGAHEVYYGYTASTGGQYNDQRVRINNLCGLPIELDTDGDGIIDSEDTDSDNDGCPDAIEAGGSFNPVDLDGNDRLSGGVDANGVPTVANGGQPDSGERKSASISTACDDFDGDGITDRNDLDDDNDGITDCIENGVANDIGDIFDINGDAQRLNAHQIRLTPAATYKSGSAFSYGKISFDKSFSFEIEVYLGNRDGNGADGIAIVFHNDPAGTGAVGATGGGLGARGIQNGIVLEFDTFDNGSGVHDIAQDHGCIWDSDDQSATPLSPARSLGNIEDGNWHTAQITWDAGAQKLIYTFDGTLAGEYTGDLINNYFGGAHEVYYGYTASTGGSYNDQRIRINNLCGLPIELDTDGDGIPNSQDLDSDNDGISDLYESGQDQSTVDTNNDGILDSTTDADNDGLMDSADADDNDPHSNGTVTPADSDGDGIPNNRDLDADNDGIPDAVEAQPTSGYQGNDGDVSDDVDSKGVPPYGLVIPQNTDGADTPDYIDTDADNDGLDDTSESGLSLSGNDNDNDGIDDAVNASYQDPDGDVNDPVNDLKNNDSDPTDADYRSVGDRDGDGIPDLSDLDNDNDGIPDADENCDQPDTANSTSGSGQYQDQLYFFDWTGSDFANGLDVGDTQTFNLPNGTVITATVTYVSGPGDPHTYRPTDLNTWSGSGLWHLYDTPGTHEAFYGGSNEDITVEFKFTATKNGQPYPLDILALDAEATASGSSEDIVFQTDGGPWALLEKVGNGGSFAGAGTSTLTDNQTDQNNFSIYYSQSASTIRATINAGGLQAVAFGVWLVCDFDNDGIPNRDDLDSDNDGIYDIVESGNGANDTDHDGRTNNPVGNNGLDDNLEDNDTQNAHKNYNIPDTDGSGGPDFLDIDADDDGIVDNIEGQTTSGYIPPSGNDTDHNGVDDAYDSNGSWVDPTDTDSDGTPDYQDTDSDNDGDSDALEAWDTDNDGTADTVASGTDADHDGLDDAYDNDDTQINPTNGQVPTDFPDMDNPGGDRDWREPKDTDNDGVPDYVDIDDDNDGIPDTEEGVCDAQGLGVDWHAGSYTHQNGTFDLSDGTNYVSMQNPAGDASPLAPHVFLNGYDSEGGGTNITYTYASPQPVYVDASGQITVSMYFYDNIAQGTGTYGNTLTFILHTDQGDLSATYNVTNADKTAMNAGHWINPVFNFPATADATYLVNGFTINGVELINGGTTASFDPANTEVFALDLESIRGCSSGRDTDGDGIPDSEDIDSDNDGIPDVVEAGGTDADHDGHVDYPTPGDPTSMNDNDGDGLADEVDPDQGGTALPNPDSDGDGVKDTQDIDADNDGIVDNIEGQSTAGYVPPTGNDSDGDGLDDAYDQDDDNTAGIGGGTGTAIDPVNTDGADNPDYLDLDSDNDNDPDALEGWDSDNNGIADITPSGTDSDNDGLDDAYDNDDTQINPTNGQAPTDFPDMDNPGGDRDWREVQDADGDGVPDYVDIDDDNDGIPDTEEYPAGLDPFADADGDGVPAYLDDDDNDTSVGNDDGQPQPEYDADGDGIPNHLDIDSDNDGIPDVVEAGGTDTDHDGHVDYPTPGDPTSMNDADGDGLADEVDPDQGGTALPNPDSDGDGVKDAQDIDADNDGIVDNIEGQSTAGYVPPTGNDSDGDGLDDAYDQDDENTVGIGGGTGTAIDPVNTDGADNPDYLDLDSDNDGDPDATEAWDTDNDGTPDTTPSGTDADGDGLDDAYDNDDTQINPTNGQVPTDFPNLDDPGTTERDWRELTAGKMEVTKTGTFNDANGNGLADAGETITYTITVTNTGNVTLTDINVTDPNATITSGSPIASLAPGASATVTAEHTLTQADIDNGGVTNQATASGQDSFGNTVTDDSDDPNNNTNVDPDGDGNPDDPTTTSVPVNASISMTKTGAWQDADGDGIMDVGETITYTITVTNDGNQTVTNIVVTDANATITSGSPIASLAPGQSATVTAEHVITQADADNGSVTNQASATGQDPQGNNVNSTTDDPSTPDPTDPTVVTVTPHPDMNVDKTGVLNDANGNGRADAGETIDYTITVTNTGNVTLTNINVTDPNATITGGSPIASLASGQSATVTAQHVLTQADIDSGSVTNQATATGQDPNNNSVSDDSDDPNNSANVDPDGDGNPDDPTVVDVPADPSMDVTKTGTLNDANGNGYADAGETIDYTITITNTGNVTLTDINVTDPNATITGGSPIASLAPGQSATVTAQHVLTQAEIDSGNVTNQATATGHDPNNNDVSDDSDDPNNPADVDPDGDGNPDDPTNTGVPAHPDMNVDKTGTFNDANGNGMADVGETITYTITVTNTGNVTLTDINVTDPNATITSGSPIASLAPGQSATVTAEHVITQADLDNGGVTNQATATGHDPNNNNVSDDSDDPNNPTNVDPDGDGNPDDSTQTNVPVNASISMTKTGAWQDADGDGVMEVGEVIAYTITVTNDGNQMVTNIVVTDANATITGGSPIASLAPGQSATVTAEHTITQADLDNGSVTNQATAQGDDPSGNPVNAVSDDPNTVDPNDATVVSTLPEPDMSVTKTGTFVDVNGNGRMDAGDRFDYTITVTNTGNVTLTNINVTDPNATITGGNPIASLTPGQSATVTAEHVITQADMDNGSVTNTATATGQDPDNNDVSDVSDDPNDNTNVDPDGDGNPDDPTVNQIDQQPGMYVTKTGVLNDANGNGYADAGETIDYTITVTNTGNVTLTDINVTDPNATITGGSPIASLAPGQSATVTAEHVITQAELDNGGVSNQATATGQDPNGNDVTEITDDPSTPDPTDPTVITTPSHADMSVTKTGVLNDANGNGYADAGETIDYTITVTNTGNVTLTNINVTDPNATITGGSPIASLAPGQSATVTAEHVITQAEIDSGSITNQATADGQDPSGNNVTDTSDDPNNATDTDPDGDGDPDDPTVTDITAHPDMTVEKTGTLNDTNGNGYADAGETIEYTITVTNTGNVTLTNINVTDPNATITGGNPIASLAPGQSATVTAEHTLTQADVDSGSFTNQASATGEDPSGNTHSEDSDDPSTPTPGDPTVTTFPVDRSLYVEKTGTFVDANGNGYADPGEVIQYTITVTNDGSVTLYNIDVTDPNATITGGSPIASLAPGQSATVTAEHVLTQADIDAGGVQNQAVATGQDGGGNSVTDNSDDPNDPTNADPDGDGNPDDVTHTSAPQHPALSVTKTAHFNDENGDGLADVGETITYTFTVTNTGNVTLTNVTIDDPLVDVTGGPITLAPGETDSSTFMATYEITAQDIENGSVSNQAVATGSDPNGNDVSDTSDNPDDPTDVDPDGDGDPDDVTVTTVTGVVISEVVTPNGDGVNDVWTIQGIEHFDNNTVELYNRWGNLVYKVTNYQNDWDGKSNVPLVVKKSETLPAGTYYYIIDLGKYGKKAGYIYINR